MQDTGQQSVGGAAACSTRSRQLPLPGNTRTQWQTKLTGTVSGGLQHFHISQHYQPELEQAAGQW